MGAMSVNQITAALAVAVLAVVSLLMWALALALDTPGPDVPVWQPVQQQPIVDKSGVTT